MFLDESKDFVILYIQHQKKGKRLLYSILKLKYYSCNILRYQYTIIYKYIYKYNLNIILYKLWEIPGDNLKGVEKYDSCVILILVWCKVIWGTRWRCWLRHLRYKPEGRGFDSRRCHRNFSFT